MNHDVAKNDVIALTPENAQELAQHPLMAVDKIVRPHLWRLWTVSQHLFPTLHPLASAVASYVEDGLDVEDAVKILGLMRLPGEQSKFRFASEFMSELARLTDVAIHRRERDRTSQITRENFATERAVNEKERDERIAKQRAELEGHPRPDFKPGELLGSLAQHFTASPGTKR